MLRRFSLLLPLILAIMISFPIVASALLSQPDSIEIKSARVFRNTVEDGDMAVVFHYDINYGSYPTTPAWDSIIFNFYDTNGTTLLISSNPYVYFNYGYGDGVGSFYMGNATAPAWGGNYNITIVGSPAYYSPVPAFNYALEAADYYALSGQDDNQLGLATYVLELCDDLEAIYTTTTLHGSTDASIGEVLSAVGEGYFRGAVPGLQSMAPGLFYTQYFVPTAATLTYSANMTSVYGARLSGTDMMQGFDAMGSHAGVSGGFMAALFCFLGAAFVMGFTVYRGWPIEPATVLGAIIMTLGAILLGETALIIRVFMGFISGIMIMFLLFFKRA